jgi:hypothetical protein
MWCVASKSMESRNRTSLVHLIRYVQMPVSADVITKMLHGGFFNSVSLSLSEYKNSGYHFNFFKRVMYIDKFLATFLQEFLEFYQYRC